MPANYRFCIDDLEAIAAAMIFCDAGPRALGLGQTDITTKSAFMKTPEDKSNVLFRFT